jgi:hypothetical protein
MPDTPYFTAAEFRTRYPDLTESRYPDATIDAWRTTAEQAFEKAAGVAFVPRQATEALYAANGTDRVLKANHRLVRAVSTATDSAGDAVDVTDSLADGSWLSLTNGWPLDDGPVTVTYTYGYDAPPEPVKQAVMMLTRVWMVEGPVTARATQIPTDTGGTINLATPGQFGSEFGVPAVDEILELYRRRTYIA